MLETKNIGIYPATFILIPKYLHTLLVAETFGLAGAFWFFGGICLVGLVFVVLCVPETQGQSLEDIEQKMMGHERRRMSSVANIKPFSFNM